MAEELADVQNAENAAALAETPVQPGETVIGREPPKTETSDKSEPPKKLSIREGLTQAIEKAKKDEAGRLHGKDGKFVPKDEKPVEVKPPAEIPKPGKDAQPSEPSKVIAGPPPGWSAESKALYASLPDPLKADILKRETEVSNGFKAKSDELKRYQEIEQVLAPARQVYQSAGVQSDAEAIKRLFAWESQIRANPAQALTNLARQYGVNLSLAQSPELSTAPDIPPALKPVLDQFGNITQEVSSLKGELQRQQEATISRELQQFAKDKPHFESVRQLMGQLMVGGVVPPNDLEGAYQKAIAIHPEVSATIALEKDTARKAEEEKQARLRVANAAKAAVSPAARTPAAPQVNGTSQAKGVRGSIMKAIDQIQGERA